MAGDVEFEPFSPAIKFVSVEKELPRKPPQAICATVGKHVYETSYK